MDDVKSGPLVRIRYWLQETLESGRFCTTGLMSQANAKKIVESQVYERSQIVLDEDGFPPFMGLGVD